MANHFRLERYLARLGVTDAVKPDLQTLTAIHAAHVDAIPFDGIDPLLRCPVKLDVASLQDKLVDGRRGGYCHEQNLLLKAALDAIGFDVAVLGGRVRWMSKPDSPLGPREHTFLRVDLPEGPYLADVGFGACILDAPLRLDSEDEQRTHMGTYRLGNAEELFWLSTKQPAGWRTMYAFKLEPLIHSDVELANWYTSTSPVVPFTKMLVMERVSRGKRFKIIGQRLAIETRDGELSEEHTIESPDELGRALEEIFRITLPVPAAEIFAKLGN